MLFQAYGDTHQGKVRAFNQDSYLLNRTLQLFAVADGVEGRPYGELASRMAVAELEKIIKDIDVSADATPPEGEMKGMPLPARAIKYALRETNRRILEKAGKEGKFMGMASTLSALWIKDDRIYVGHVGDSRIYLIRKNRAQQLTRDHTTMAEAEPNTAEDIELYEDISPASEHELSRALGITPDVQVQLSGGTPQPGDVFLLCTDGLYSQMREFEMVEAVAGKGPELACKKLIQLANAKGGKDNVALIIVQVS
jgi:protein phosphatase